MQTKSKTDPLVAALRRPRYEAIPLPEAEEAVAEYVPKDIKLTVTASPTKGIEATLEFAERLSKMGYDVSPHLSARLVRDGAHLEEVLGRLDGAGIRDVFVVAGDAPGRPGYEGAGDMLRAMAGLRHGIEEIGITGYPESHPVISDEATVRAMSEKAPYATYIVSQLCFDASVTAGWIHDVRERGVELPIYIGVPGVVGMVKLMRVSAKIGLGDSARFLKKHGGRLARMLSPGGYDPDRLLEGLAPAFADPSLGARGFHVYTFNEFEKTEVWRQNG